MPAFYELIRQARTDPDSPMSPSADPERLRAVLDGLDNDAVMAFGVQFDAELLRLNQWTLWDAGYVIASGMGDDAFHYFRSWVIGKGEAAVIQALTDADGLVDFLDTRDPDNELLEYVAIDLLEERGVAEDPRDVSPEHADSDPVGTHIKSEAAQYRRFRRLAAWNVADKARR